MDFSDNMTENVFDLSISIATPIWKMLNMTENEYKEKHCKPFVIDAANNKIEINDIIEIDNSVKTI